MYSVLFWYSSMLLSDNKLFLFYKKGQFINTKELTLVEIRGANYMNQGGRGEGINCTNTIM